MSKKAVIVVDILAEIVTAVSAKTLVSISKNVNFLHGHAEEIEADLVEATKAQALDNTIRKYPLIALFQDFPEERGQQSGYYAEVVIPLIIIATITSNTLKAPARYNATFRPVLYPIYEEFLTQIQKHKAVSVANTDEIRHTKIDRLYWGSKTAGQGLNDYVDAIEISNMRLTIKQFC